jgi:hypothetical protein
MKFLTNQYKKEFLTFISSVLELLCRFTHPFVELEIRLTGRHCNLAMLSYRMSMKYNLDTWKKGEEK